ncbi:hypothetical protein RSAG8_10641, partial [Rhizoctonia solani AG-8 WAC10335]
MQLFDECRDGLILCKLINDSVPETIDTRVLNVPKTKKGLNAFQITENITIVWPNTSAKNNNIVITSAKAIGCSVVNIGSSDIAEGREHLILGLIWQIIRRGLLSKIDLKNHPELYRLLEEDETVEDLLKLPPDQLLLRWFNYHLKAAGHKRRVKNFGRDVADGENYTILLNQLKPNECSRAPLQERDLLKRAEMVLRNADKIGCRKYLSAQAMVAGNPKLNLAYLHRLSNGRAMPHCGIRLSIYKTLSSLTKTGRPPTDQDLLGWANNTVRARNGSTPNSPPLRSFKDSALSSAVFFLDLLDAMKPGIVDYSLVYNPARNDEDKKQNAKLAISIARKMNALIFLVPEDIVDIRPRLVRVHSAFVTSW